MYMERKRLSPEGLNEQPHKRIKPSDAPSLNRLQELRKYHLRATNLYLGPARPNEALTSGLDRPSARQTEDCSSECKEVSALPNVWDKGKRSLSPEEERQLKKWLKSIPIGEDGKRAPRIDLSTKFTPNHLILVGGMNRGETSRRNDLAGERFEGPRYGNYCCGRRLGKGAFGEVYLAQHRTSKEIVAIKVLQKLGYAYEFEYEAKVLKSLNHPNIVHFVEYNGNHVPPYLVMEYACHGTLRNAPPKSLKQVTEYVDQIANALDYLHNCPHEIEKGKGKARPLMHLDLKPENILLGEGPDGKEKILLADLGLAQEVHMSGSQPPYWAGTPAYMSPEVNHYRKPRPESDQYALAIMVYEWLSGGQRPGPNPKPLSGISDGINKIILKALDNDPSRRFEGVKAFAKAFRDAYVKYEVERGIQIDKHYNAGEEYLKARQYKKACDDFTRVIALNEEYSGAFAYRGRAYLELRQFKNALADFNQALKLDKKNPYALVNRGITYREMGQYEKAWADFNQVCDLGHSRPWIEDELKKLRHLMKGNRR